MTSDEEDWARFQRQVAGDREVRLSGGGRDIWADGVAVDPDTVVAAEAKFVSRPGRSLYEGDLPPKAAAHWAPHAQVREDTGPDDVTDATILVERPDKPAFHILHSRSGRSVFTDGTPDQAAEVAAWVAENFPPDGVEVWLTDDAYTRHIVLTPGMTPADVVAAPWQPH